MRISFRLNEHNDAELIKQLEPLKNKNLSKTIRQILYYYFFYSKVSDNLSDKRKILKWDFPKEE